MYNKLIAFLLAICLIGLSGSSYSNDRYKSIKIVNNGDALRGDTGPLVYGPPAPVNIYSSPVYPPVVYSTDAITFTVTEILPQMRTAYDLQSNGVPRYIWQVPASPNNIHVIMMASTDPGPIWSDRNVRYAFSTNRGSTWTYLGTVTSTRSGFPCLVSTSNGRAIVLAHANDGGGLVRSQLWVDLAPGVGSWERLDPGTHGNTNLGPIWPMAALDLNNNHVIFAASQNGVDSAFVNVCTNLVTPGTFLGYKSIPNSETANQYSPAVGTGKIGVAFNTQSGGAALTESTDGGLTWGTPVTIINWNPVDSMGTLRSIDMAYEGANARVVLGLGHVDPVNGTFFPGLPSRLVFWGPDINGGVPVLIDSSQGLRGSNPTNSVFFSTCRGVIGKSSDGNALYVAWNRTSGDTSDLGNDFFNVWFAYSTNHGASWQEKTKITNVSGPLRDCRYVSISPSNSLLNGDYKAYLVFQSDSIAGSNVSGAPPSIAKLMFADITISLVGIINTSSEIPGSYSLSQNYPNPFNPETVIKFALPKGGLVTLKLYDVTGKEIGLLVNQQLSAGSYEYEMNADNLPSGVYFYQLNSNDFADTKKMVLIK